MANFNFKLLTGTDPQAQYDSITTKDSMTFYLLKNGIGYLGETKLFDATDTEIDGIVTDMTAEDFVADDGSVASTKAITDYVAAQINDLSILSASFFRKVVSHTLTEEDIANDAISVPENTVAGDVGLLFTADGDMEDGGESYYFISLTDYLNTVYTFNSSNSITMTTGEDNSITAELKIKEGEESLKIDEENGGVYIEKATTINDGDGTDENGEAPSAAKLVTEEALVNYITSVVLPAVNTAITEALADVVTYSEDDGTTSES